MHNFNFSLYRKPGPEPDPATLHGILDHDPDNSNKFMVQVNQMNNYVENLEKSLGELKSKIKAYQDLILKYESIFREEVLLYRLHKSELTTMKEAFCCQESFTKEIEQQISTFIHNSSQQQDNRFSSFKRIILRFFHQNRLNQNQANSKISEIENLINKKQQLLERFQTDVKNWKKRLSLALPASDSQQITLN